MTLTRIGWACGIGLTGTFAYAFAFAITFAFAIAFAQIIGFAKQSQLFGDENIC